MFTCSGGLHFFFPFHGLTEKQARGGSAGECTVNAPGKAMVERVHETCSHIRAQIK